MKTYSTSVISKKKLTYDVFEFKIERPKDFAFIAGQFLQFSIPDGEKKITRSYSIASTTQDEHISLCIKYIEGGKGSQYFKKLQIGDIVTFTEAIGRFICSNDVQGHYFIATGAGIAPMISMIREEIEVKKTEKEIHLLFGVRSEDDVFWVDEFEKLKHNYPLFNYSVTLSQPKAGGGWSGLRGRVTDHLLHHLVSHSFYLCGNSAMITEVRKILLENGVEMKHIHFEAF